MPSAERRLPKYIALAAPVLFIAANACSENKTHNPNPTQGPTLGGQVKPEVITPQTTITPVPTAPSNIENFDPNEGQPSIDGLLYTLDTLELSLPPGAYEALQNRFEDIKILSSTNPKDQRIADGLNKVGVTMESICDIPGVKKLKTDTATYMYRNFPQDYQKVNGLWEMGRCAVEPQNSGQALASTPESRPNTRSSVLARSGIYEFQLYADVSLEEVIRTANALPQSNAKPEILESLSVFKTTQENRPGTDILISLMDKVVALNDANCQGALQIEFAKLTASYLNQKFPTQFSRSNIFEQGSCTPIEEARTQRTESQDLVPATGLSGDIVFWTDTYTYALTSEDIQTRGDRFSDPVALSIAFGPNQAAFEKVFPIAEELDRVRQIDTYNPAQLPIFQEILSISTKEVCDASKVGGVKGYLRGIASVEYHMDPNNWPSNANKYVNHPCFWGDKF